MHITNSFGKENIGDIIVLEKLILLIDNRKEQATKYKKILKAEDLKLIVKSSIKEALNDIATLQPDMLILSDSATQNFSEDIHNLKLLSYKFQPVIIALSKSSDIQTKIDTLKSGADDFFEEPFIKEEFLAKINAHLRRLLENQTNLHTGLYNAKISYKAINRTMIYNDKNWAVMLIGINNFDKYKEIYGELAAEKMLQAYIAIINSTLDSSDYLGQLSNDDFILITDSLKAEKMSAYFIQAFDLISTKFYSEQDLKQGYIILSGDDIEEKPIPLVNTSIAVVTNEFKKYNDLKELMTDLLVLHKVVRNRVGSDYLFDRPKIGGKNTTISPIYNNKILLIEEDSSLNLLIESNLIMRNCTIKSYTNIKEITIDILKEYKPAVVIFDAGQDKELSNLEYCDKFLAQETNNTPRIILTSIFHDKEKILSSGADFYLPKPYEIKTLMYWVEKFLKEYNS